MKNALPEEELIATSTDSETEIAVSSATNKRVLIMADERGRATGKGSGIQKLNLLNLFEQARKFGANLIACSKELRKSYLCKYYFEMFGWDNQTGESRAIWYDQDLRPIGLVILAHQDGEEEVYNMFEAKKDTSYSGMQGTGGEIGAFDLYNKDAIADIFLEYLQTSRLVIKTKGEAVAIMESAKFKEIYPTHIPKKLEDEIADLALINLRTLSKRIADAQQTEIDPAVIEAVAERLAQDSTFYRIKSEYSIRNFIRSYCTDVVKDLMQINAIANLIYYKQKELHANIVISGETTERNGKGPSEWGDDITEIDKLHFEHFTKVLEWKIPKIQKHLKLKSSSKRNWLLIETLKRKAAGETHDDVIKELNLGHGSVTNYITEMQTYYMGYAGQDTEDEELTERGIDHISAEDNSTDPDVIILGKDQTPVEVWSLKTFLDFDFFTATDRVGVHEKAYAEAHHIPLLLKVYECRGYKWHTLRWIPQVKNGQAVKGENAGVSVTSPSLPAGLSGHPPLPEAPLAGTPTIAGIAMGTGGGQARRKRRKS